MDASFAILSSFIDPVVASDSSGIIIFINQATSNLFGYEKNELLGQNVSILADPDTARHHDSYMRRYTTTGQSHGMLNKPNRELFGKHKDGKMIPVGVSLSKHDDGQKVHFVAIFRDLSAQRETEKELLKAKEITVGKEAAMTASQDLLRYIEHEVRQPLNGIMGVLDLVEDDLSTAPSEINPETFKDHIKVAKRCADHLLTIISDFVDIRKLESGSIELHHTKTTLRQIIKDSVDILRKAFSEKPKVKFVFEPAKGYDPSGEYNIDGTRLRQILVNLISNAIKFTEVGTVSLKVTVTPQGLDDMVLFEVVDTGLGISPEVISKIFPISSSTETADGVTEAIGTVGVGRTPRPSSEGSHRLPSQHAPFVSGTQSDLRTFQGTGLGLRLCQLLTSVMAGCMGCKSVHPPVIADDGSGSGTTFWVELPLSRLSRKSPVIDARGPASPGHANLGRPNRGHISSSLVKESHFSMDAESNSDSDNEPILDTSSGFSRQPNRPRKLSFLVVDDMKINRQILRTILHKLGHAIQEAENGEQALQLVETQHFDLIFMDVRMPVLGGREATLKIRSHPNEQLRSIPIVAITGDVCAEDVKRSLDAGMNAVLTKPITRDSVIKIITKL